MRRLAVGACFSPCALLLAPGFYYTLIFMYVSPRCPQRSQLGICIPRPPPRSCLLTASVLPLRSHVLCALCRWPVTRLVKGIVEEKQLKIKEGMRMMGLPDSALFCSWFTTYLVMFLLTALGITIVTAGSVYERSNKFFIFVFFFTFVSHNDSARGEQRAEQTRATRREGGEWWRCATHTRRNAHCCVLSPSLLLSRLSSPCPSSPSVGW